MTEKRRWSSKDFKKAAQKHYLSCCYLIDNIETLKPDSKNHVVSNLYYLSGYIIECILKHSIMEQMHKKISYSLSELEDIGIKTHDIKQLWIKAHECKGLNIVHLKWHEVTKAWDVDVRYDTVNDNFRSTELVSKHFKQVVTPIYTAVTNKY